MRQRLSVYGPWLAIVLLAAAALPSPVAAQAPAVTVFEGARLITGDGGAPIEDSAFVVEGNRITQVGRKRRSSRFRRARGASISPARPSCPALSMRTAIRASSTWSTGKMSKENFTRENYIDHLQRYAYHGVAAVL